MNSIHGPRTHPKRPAARSRLLSAARTHQTLALVHHRTIRAPQSLLRSTLKNVHRFRSRCTTRRGPSAPAQLGPADPRVGPAPAAAQRNTAYTRLWCIAAVPGLGVARAGHRSPATDLRRRRRQQRWAGPGRRTQRCDAAGSDASAGTYCTRCCCWREAVGLRRRRRSAARAQATYALRPGRDAGCVGGGAQVSTGGRGRMQDEGVLLDGCINTSPRATLQGMTMAHALRATGLPCPRSLSTLKPHPHPLPTPMPPNTPTQLPPL